MPISACQVFRNPLHLIAFGFGTGLLPLAPGTWGTLLAIPIYIGLHYLSWPVYLLAVIVFTVISIWICDWSSKKIGVHDYPGMNLDEIVGYLWVMFAVPFTWYWLVIGFIIFRLFDIWKPWPIRWLDEKVSGGFGIVIDDIVAALYTWATLQIVFFILVFRSL